MLDSVKDKFILKQRHSHVETVSGKWFYKQSSLLRQTPALQGVQKQGPGGHEMERNGTDGRRFPRYGMNGAQTF